MQIYKIHTINKNYFPKIKIQFSPDTIPAFLLSSPSTHTCSVFAPYLFRSIGRKKERSKYGAGRGKNSRRAGEWDKRKQEDFSDFPSSGTGTNSAELRNSNTWGQPGTSNNKRAI
jgi:hypothetical protein